MSAVYVGIFHVLQHLVAVGDEVLMVALQIIALNRLGARDAVEVLQQEFCHGDTLGEKGKQSLTICDSISQKIAMRAFCLSEQVENASIKAFSGMEKVFEAFRGCKSALHRCHCNTVSSF